MSGVHRFQVGAFACAALYDGSREGSLAETFPAIAAATLAATGVADALTVGYNVLFVDTGRHKILVDTGGGQGALAASLLELDLMSVDIDIVVLTHGDGDHIGGIPAFTAAEFALWQGAWDLWTEPAGREQMIEQFTRLFAGKVPADRLALMAAGRARFGQEVLPALRERLRLVETNGEVVPGIRLLAAPGHRSDHTAVAVESEGAALLHVVDSLRHPLQAANPDWYSYIDSFPEQLAATNRQLLDWAAARDALVFGAHLPFPGLARVTAAGDAWSMAPPSG